MTIHEYIRLRDKLIRKIANLEERLADLSSEAASIPIPSNLRPATSHDIVEGMVIWYTDTDEDSQPWVIVEEVLSPSDKWKAFTYEGARYGLENAHVEYANADI